MEDEHGTSRGREGSDRGDERLPTVTLIDLRVSRAFRLKLTSTCCNWLASASAIHGSCADSISKTTSIFRLRCTRSCVLCRSGQEPVVVNLDIGARQMNDGVDVVMDRAFRGSMHLQIVEYASRRVLGTVHVRFAPRIEEE